MATLIAQTAKAVHGMIEMHKGTAAEINARYRTMIAWADMQVRCENLLPNDDYETIHSVIGSNSTYTKLIFYCQHKDRGLENKPRNWKLYRIVATPTFEGFELKVTGRGDKKDFIYDTFSLCLSQEVGDLWVSRELRQSQP